MPELPEVETVRRGLAPHMEGCRIDFVEQRRPDLRFPFPADFVARLSSQRIVKLDRRAKYLLIRLENGWSWLVHLGMSGRFTVQARGEMGANLSAAGKRMATSAQARGASKRATGNANGAEGPNDPNDPDNTNDPENMGIGHNSGWALAEKHDHVVVTMETGDRIVFNDPRRFGFMSLIAPGDEDKDPFLAALGPEPLGAGFSVASLDLALAGKRTPIKAALLDQRVVAGLGNIYVCEALWRAGISPKRLARSIPGKRSERLVPAIKQVLQEAIEAGGSSLRDYVQASGELGYFQHAFDAYDREGTPCRLEGCAGVVRRIVQSGRSTFYCPQHQR